MRRVCFALTIACRLWAQVTPDQAIRSILAERIDNLHQGVGIVIGIVDHTGPRFISYGKFGLDDPRPVDEDTVFEIGSVTKIFTSTILADMVQRGEVSLNDPVAKYLPLNVKMPRHAGKQIVLLDLATHTSGLPRMPTNVSPKNLENSLADYTVLNLFEFLSGFQLKRNIGSKFEYSNLGVGLLGQALAGRAGMDYEAMVKARVTSPLGMDNTGIALTQTMQAHFAKGYDWTRAPAPPWDIPALAAAGALRSNARDLLIFVAANLGYLDSPLAPAMHSMIKVRRKAEDGYDISLGWIVATRRGRQIFWHDGATNGYQAFAGYDAKSKVGIVALSNMNAPVDDIGMYLLDPSTPLEKLKPLVSEEDKPDPAFSENPEFAGRLERVRNGSISVRLDDGRLIDAVLPNSGNLASAAIAGQFKVADRVLIGCKQINAVYDADDGLHQHLELKSLRLLRPATASETADAESLLAWQRAGNLLKLREGAATANDASEQAKLQDVRQVNLNYFSTLPDLLADEAARQYSSSVTAKRWRFLDTVDTEITLGTFRPGAGSGMFRRRRIRWNGLDWGRPFEELEGQLWYGFGIELYPLFHPDCPTKIEFLKHDEVGGQPVLVYRFSSPPGGCFFTYVWGNTHNRYNPARVGRILVDANRLNVIRYEEQAEGYPPQFGIDRDTIVENWDWVKIGAASYCVPVSADFVRQKSNGSLQRTIVEYKNHRRFQASTTVNFDKEH